MSEEILAITRAEWSDGKDLPGGDVPVTQQEVISSCSQGVWCKCLTDGRPLPTIKKFGDHNLGGGGVPECSQEVRHLLHPEKSEQQLVLMYRKWRDQQKV